MKKILYFTLIISALVSCVHDPLEGPGTGNPDNGENGGGNTDCDPNTVYFTNTILPLLQSRCAQPGCHSQADMEDGVGMFSYDIIMEQVSPGNPGNSDLWEAITDDDPEDRMPPAGEGTLSTEEINTITTWIQQGAQNNTCTSDCDPGIFTFSGAVQSTIQTYCQGCHSGSNPDAGISLTGYSQIQAIALDGRLMHALNGTGGYTQMPYQSNPLSDCRKQQIQAWIDSGSPNN